MRGTGAIASAQMSAGTGGGGYQAKAVHFDGATSLGIGSLTASDADALFFSLWFKFAGNTDSGTNSMFFVVDPNGEYAPSPC